MPEQLVPETRLERFLSSIVYNTDVPEERRNRLERWLGAILKRNAPPDAPYDRLERWLKEIYENVEHTVQFSGLNVEFWSGSEGNVKSITLPIEYVQSGSGEPSPENARPISGWIGATVKRYGTDEADRLVTLNIPFPEEAGTVYTGTLDVTTGILTLTHFGVTYSNASGWELRTGTPYGFCFSLSNILPKYNHTRSTFKLPACNILPVYSTGGVNEVVANALSVYTTNTVGSTNYVFYLRLENYNVSTLQELDSWLSENPLQVVYELETPVTYQLTPSQLTTLSGINHITAKLYNESSSVDVNISVKV